jgi:hypothetical protein
MASEKGRISIKDAKVTLHSRVHFSSVSLLKIVTQGVKSGTSGDIHIPNSCVYLSSFRFLVFCVQTFTSLTRAALVQSF